MPDFLGGMLGGLFGGAASIYNNEKNLEFQRQAQDYTKWLNEVTWQREDSAVQRRTADLKAAGLSPVLAAGSSAQAGSPIKIDPLESKDALGAEGFMSGVTKAAQTQQSLAAVDAAKQNVELMKDQENKVKAETAFTNLQTELFRQGKHPSQMDVWGKRVAEILSALKGNSLPSQVGPSKFQKSVADADKTPAERMKETGHFHLYNWLDKKFGK